MENCEADKIAEDFFYTSYWKSGKWSLCKKRLYKGVSINSCSVDVSTIKNTSYLIKTKNSFENTYNNCGTGLQHGTSPVVSFSRIFAKYWEHLRIFVLLFLTAMCQTRIYSLCFFKKSEGLYFFSANWLYLVIVIDR